MGGGRLHTGYSTLIMGVWSPPSPERFMKQKALQDAAVLEELNPPSHLLSDKEGSYLVFFLIIYF